MKRVVLTLLFMAFFATPTLAGCNYLNRCPAYSGNQTAQFFSNATGSTFFAEEFAKSFAQNELKKATGQIFNVDIKAFSVGELLEGKFKSLTISGNNVEIEGFHFSSLNIKTLCGFNHININSKPISLKENLVLDVSAQFSSADLRNTVAYKNYLNEIQKQSLSEIGISSFRLYTPTIDIRNGKLYFTINATPFGPYPPMDISIGADIKVQDGKLVKSQIEFINLYTGFDLTQFSNFLATLNNFNFLIPLDGSKKAEVQIQHINIVGDKIFINGTVFIPKNSN